MDFARCMQRRFAIADTHSNADPHSYTYADSLAKRLRPGLGVDYAV